MKDITYNWNEKGYRVNHNMVALDAMMLTEFSKIIDSKIVKFDKRYVYFRLQLLLEPLMNNPMDKAALSNILQDCVNSINANQPIYQPSDEDN